jgi:hypothetical protein
MLRLFSRGQNAPQVKYLSRFSSSVRLHRAKLAAWAIAVGERPRSADPPYRSRRQHRGMLDDLPQPETPELAPMPVMRAFVEIIERLLAFGPVPAAGRGAVAGDPKTPVGENAPVTYIDRSDAGDSTVSPADADRHNAQSRAA